MHIRKRGKSFQLDYAINGKRVQKSFRTKREANDHYNKVAAEIVNGTYIVETEKENLGIFAAGYLERRWKDVESNILERSSYLGIEQHINLHILPNLSGAIALPDITREMMQGVVYELGKTLSPKTIKNVIRSANHMFNDAALSGKILARIIHHG